MKKASIFAVGLAFSLTAHSAGCLYLVEAHSFTQKLTFLSERIEIGYPAGSATCDKPARGPSLTEFARTERVLEDKFLTYIGSKYPGAEVARKDVHTRFYTDERELEWILVLAKHLTARDMPDARGHRLIVLSGRFY